MSTEDEAHTRSTKRLKTSHFDGSDPEAGRRVSSLPSLSRSITPPSSRQKLRERTDSKRVSESQAAHATGPNLIPSPVQLTYIRDLPGSSGDNSDAIRLRDILGDPLIKECWQFNYLIDVDFLMGQFDIDVRSLVKVKVVHGSWKRESATRIHIDEACSRYPNVEPIVAYMPEPFGTHHSKMMVLVRHDDTAQIIIHTANMIPRDWTNMCQAVWRSPLLPLSPEKGSETPDPEMPIGSGPRFKRDVISYLQAYGRKKTGSLVDQLSKFDFKEVKAALIASVPSKQGPNHLDSRRNPKWGWPSLRDTLRKIPLREAANSQESTPHIAIQVSSVATLGKESTWLKKTLFDSLYPPRGGLKDKSTVPAKFSIIFPTPDEIRKSLDGYASGGSIHMKLQSDAQQKQLSYLRPHLCRWTGYVDNRDLKKPAPQSRNITRIGPNTGPNNSIREAGRRRAAPHIKTYVRFADTNMTTIDWAMITSANLSTQAWGAAPNAKGEVRICSWEIGVLFWPDLFLEGAKDEGAGEASRRTEMVPCFKRDLPFTSSSSPDEFDEMGGPGSETSSPVSTRVGFRMPYDLPLRPYTDADTPWCATSTYSEPDWLGQTWESSYG